MGDPRDQHGARRPLRSRNIVVFQRLATGLGRSGVAPNAISVLSMAFAAGAGAALAATSWTEGGLLRGCWLLAAGLIQLRLLANMLDGMVAMESGRASPVGELYNEAPDRISDAAILIGAGFATGGEPWLGWLAAIIALLVAYLRALGAAAGAGQAFHGPMAKPHRMFAITIVCLYCAATPAAWQPIDSPTGWGLAAWMLVIIIAGGLLTLARRWRWITMRLRERGP